MEYWFVLITTVSSLAIMFIITKFVGYRSIASMSMFDYINSIVIGSIAAQLTIAKEDEILHNIIAMVLYGILTFLCAILSEKLKICRTFLVGHPIVLVEKGQYYFKNFKKAHLEMEEFQAMARQLGYFDLTKIDTAVLETTGQLSVIPIADEKPVVAQDVNVVPSQEAIFGNIILDGDICEDNLRRMGKDKTWLEKEISRYKITDRSEIFLATLSQDGKLDFYIKVKPPKKDIL